MKYCTNCGHELKEGADLCLNCGKLVNNKNVASNTNFIAKDKNDGFNIASMVLVIISSCWGLLTISSFTEAIYETANKDTGYILSFYLGYTLFSLIPSILGLIFGIISYIKHKKTSSLIYTIVSLLIFIICIGMLFALLGA